MSDNYILLSAGSSRDLKHPPKSLWRYRGRTVLNHQIKCIKEFDENAKIITVLGYGADDIVKTKPQCTIVFNDYYADTNQSDSLILALREVKYHNLWIIHGDVIFTKSIFKIPDPKQPYVFLTYSGFHKTKVGLCYYDNQLLNLEYGIETKWAQISYIPKHLLKDFYIVCRPNMFTHEVLNQFNKIHPFSVHYNKKAVVSEL